LPSRKLYGILEKIINACGGVLVGEILKKRREELGMDLREISETLKIKYAYLKALEDDDLKNLPAEVYVKAYLNSYARSLDLNPEEILNTYNSYYQEGNNYLESQNYQEAIKSYNQALEIISSEPNIYNQRGNAYYYIENYEQAINDYNQAIELDHEYVSAYFNKGKAYSNLENYQQAIQNYQQAADLYNQKGQINEYENCLKELAIAESRQIEIFNYIKFNQGQW